MIYTTVGFLIVLGLLRVVAKLADHFPKQCDAVYCFFKKHGCLILFLIFGFLYVFGFWIPLLILLAAFAVMGRCDCLLLSP